MAKRTKIICTLGPAVDSESTLRNLALAGMDVARLNFSHANHEEHAARIDRLKKVRRELGLPLAILLDTKGPEIRTGLLDKHAPVRLRAGKQITLTEEPVLGTAERIHQDHPGLYAFVQPGTIILLDNGLIELAVDEVRGTDIVATVQNTGILGERKGVNLPGTKVELPTLTEGDKRDLLFGIEQGVDIVAATFIRNAESVKEVRAFLEENGGAEISVIAKIENAEGVENIDEIIEAADGVMIARGDLGVEVPAERVPYIQKEIISRCNECRKPVITSTQMLDSMINNPRPTRAEVADVANAIFDGSDALLLAGETAIGKYPVVAVRMMASIAESTEEHLKNEPLLRKYASLHESGMPAQRVSPAVGMSAVATAEAADAAAIVTPTTSGRTARLISAFRPKVPIYAVTASEGVMRRLQLFWGVTPMLGNVEVDMEETIENARAAVCGKGLLREGDIAVFTAGDASTSPRLESTAGKPCVSAPTNIMYVIEIHEGDQK